MDLGTNSGRPQDHSERARTEARPYRRYEAGFPSESVLILVPSLVVGGAERSAARVATALADWYSSTLCSLVPTVAGTRVEVGTTTIELNIAGGRHPVGKAVKWIRRIAAVRQLKKRLNPVATISLLEGADYVNILSGGPGAVIVSVRGSKLLDQNLDNVVGKLRIWILVRYLYRRADVLVAISTGVAHELQRILGRRQSSISVIGNSVSPASIVAAEENHGADPALLDWCRSRPFFVCHGRLAPEKNLAFLIELLARLRQRGEHVHLLLIGSGPSKESLKLLASDLGLAVGTGNAPGDADVVFAAETLNPYSYLRLAAAYVQASNHEGFGNSLLEALSLGLPVLVADVPHGPAEVLDWRHVRRPQKPTGHQFRAPGGYLLPAPGAETVSTTWTAWINAAHRVLANQDHVDELRSESLAQADYWSPTRELERWLAAIDEAAGIRSGRLSPSIPTHPES